MAKQELTDSLDQCLLRARDGDALGEPPPPNLQESEALAPLLVTAERLRVLKEYRLPEARRQRAKAALQTAWVAGNAATVRAQGRRAWLSFPRALASVKGGALALVMTLVLAASLTVTVVAASKPGDVGYPARVALERVPALVLSRTEQRADAELAIADRRLADLDAHMQRTGRLAPAAIEALLKGNAAAVAAAANLDEAGQHQVAARITVHAVELNRLADAATTPDEQVALRTASQQAAQLTIGLGSPSPEPPQPAGPLPEITVMGPPTWRPEPAGTPMPRFPSVAPGLRETAHATASSAPPWRQAATNTPQVAGSPKPGQQSTATPSPSGQAATPTSDTTPEGPGPSPVVTEIFITDPPTAVPPAAGHGTGGTPDPAMGTPPRGQHTTEPAHTIVPTTAPTATKEPERRGLP